MSEDELLLLAPPHELKRNNRLETIKNDHTFILLILNSIYLIIILITNIKKESDIHLSFTIKRDGIRFVYKTQSHLNYILQRKYNY